MVCLRLWFVFWFAWCLFGLWFAVLIVFCYCFMCLFCFAVIRIAVIPLLLVFIVLCVCRLRCFWFCLGLLGCWFGSWGVFWLGRFPVLVWVFSEFVFGFDVVLLSLVDSSADLTFLWVGVLLWRCLALVIWFDLVLCVISFGVWRWHLCWFGDFRFWFWFVDLAVSCVWCFYLVFQLSGCSVFLLLMFCLRVCFDCF